MRPKLKSWTPVKMIFSAMCGSVPPILRSAQAGQRMRLTPSQ